jgi:hypothetical protein
MLINLQAELILKEEVHTVETSIQQNIQSLPDTRLQDTRQRRLTNHHMVVDQITSLLMEALLIQRKNRPTVEVHTVETSIQQNIQRLPDTRLQDTRPDTQRDTPQRRLTNRHMAVDQITSLLMEAPLIQRKNRPMVDLRMVDSPIQLKNLMGVQIMVDHHIQQNQRIVNHTKAAGMEPRQLNPMSQHDTQLLDMKRNMNLQSPHTVVHHIKSRLFINRLTVGHHILLKSRLMAAHLMGDLPIQQRNRMVVLNMEDHHIRQKHRMEDPRMATHRTLQRNLTVQVADMVHTQLNRMFQLGILLQRTKKLTQRKNQHMAMPISQQCIGHMPLVVIK